MRRYLTGLDTAVSSAAVAFGFTLTVWSSGAFLISSQGSPGAGQVVLFATGTILAYGTLEVVTARAGTGSTLQIGQSPHWLRAGVVHTAAIAAALAAAAFLAQLDTRVAWIVAPFVAVVLYLLISGIEMALLDAEGAGEES